MSDRGFQPGGRDILEGSSERPQDWFGFLHNKHYNLKAPLLWLQTFSLLFLLWPSAQCEMSKCNLEKMGLWWADAEWGGCRCWVDDGRGKWVQIDSCSTPWGTASLSSSSYRVMTVPDDDFSLSHLVSVKRPVIYLNAWRVISAVYLLSCF